MYLRLIYHFVIPCACRQKANPCFHLGVVEFLPTQVISIAANKANSSDLHMHLDVHVNVHLYVHVPDTGDVPIVYCDGSCLDNGQPTAKAGIGVFWRKGDPR